MPSVDPSTPADVFGFRSVGFTNVPTTAVISMLQISGEILRVPQPTTINSQQIMYFTHSLLATLAAASALATTRFDNVPPTFVTAVLAVPAIATLLVQCNPTNCRAQCGVGCGGLCVQNANTGAVVRSFLPLLASN
jgi:hypothetical protein